MDKDIPKIDLPEDWLIGTDISKELLGLYKNFPIRLKCEIIVLCMDGEIDAMVNLNSVKVKKYDVITLVPGTIFQINDIFGDLKIYFLGFSSKYIEQKERSKAMVETIILTMGNPLISLKKEGAVMLEEYMRMLIKMYEYFDDNMRIDITPNLFADVHKGISILYKRIKSEEKVNISKSEKLCRDFTQMVMQNYSKNRNVSWYAEKLNISHAHLCSIVKQTTGKTCVDIISSMVIMDAKSQLKSTQLSIQEISDSLNFANMSFFGKYFKRYVGMSPLEYRNKG